MSWQGRRKDEASHAAHLLQVMKLSALTKVSMLFKYTLVICLSFILEHAVDVTLKYTKENEVTMANNVNISL